MASFKNALISVSDKTGLLDFVKPLAAKGMRIVSTGGTSKYLKEAGFAVVDVSEQTGFPEVMDGRVKTLHPKIHMALLGKWDDPAHMKTLREADLQPFDLVIGNLYPFEDALARGAVGEELIEYIDIGGPSFLRSASKNFHSVAVVCDPSDYSWISKVVDSEGTLTLAHRQKLAAKVFAHTASYDAMIASELGKGLENYHSVGGIKVQDLRYGENPHQAAAWFKRRGSRSGLHQAKILQGKELSFNNLLDLHAASALVVQFEAPSIVAVKHNNPCGVGSGSTLLEATEKGLKADPVSVFGGIVALNRPLEADVAEKLSVIFLECIVAPQVSDAAKAIFAKKKNLRILEWPQMARDNQELEIKSVLGGYLVQQSDSVDKEECWTSDWKVMGKELTSVQRAEVEFAWKVCSSLKSNAIAITSGGQSLGLGMGQVNRVEAVGHAIERLKKHHHNIARESCVLASDAFFPFADSIELIADAGIKYVVQPGGSVNDEAVKEAALQRHVTLIFTGKRHFRH